MISMCRPHGTLVTWIGEPSSHAVSTQRCAMLSVTSRCSRKDRGITGLAARRVSPSRPPDTPIASAHSESGWDGQEGKIMLYQLDRTPSADEQDTGARHPHRASLLEEDAAVAIGIDAERRGEVEEDGAADDAERERRADDLRRRDDEQNRGEKLHAAGADAHEFLVALETEPIGKRREQLDAPRMPEELILEIPDVDVDDECRHCPGNETENLLHDNLRRCP